MRYSRLCFSFMSQHCGDLTVGVTITGDDMGLSDQVCDAILNFYIWIKNKARVSILKLMFVMMFSCRQGEKDLSLVSLGLSHGVDGQNQSVLASEGGDESWFGEARVQCQWLIPLKSYRIGCTDKM